jgi:hypothetical protein
MNSIRPQAKEKYKIDIFTVRFQSQIGEQIIKQVLKESLTGHKYVAEEVNILVKEISQKIKDNLKKLELPRYKYVVNVVIGEMKGEGVRMNARCFWDQDSDSMAQSEFINVSAYDN